jgi:hypothetical protein
MNLLQRLKPHYRQKLQESNNKYPLLVGDITSQLEENKFITDLSYRTVVQMNFIFDSLDAFKFFEEYDS